MEKYIIQYYSNESKNGYINKKRVDFRAKIIVIIIMGQREAPYSVKMVNLSRRHGTSKNVWTNQYSGKMQK